MTDEMVSSTTTAYWPFLLFFAMNMVITLETARCQNLGRFEGTLAHY